MEVGSLGPRLRVNMTNLIRDPSQVSPAQRITIPNIYIIKNTVDKFISWPEFSNSPPCRTICNKASE